ncbi:MAG: peptidase, partial [Nitrosopumilaceae archaeon]
IKLLVFSIGLLSISFIPLSFGHGIGYEVLPPVKLGDREVALEVTSSQYEDPDNPDREITFALFDTSSGITLRDVTYHIKGEKGDQFLFEDTFKSNNGIFVMNLLQSDSGEITVEKEMQGSFFDVLVGKEKDVVVIKGDAFKSGGLYTFDVEIQTAESYSEQIETPIQYDVGLSIPDRTYYDLDDPNFGKQTVSIITYYDEIQNFQYDSEQKSLSFFMPFEWDVDNINQTSVVHEEFTIPKAFGDLLVSDYTASVNGFQVDERVITIDDFSEVQRIVHLVLNQNDLHDLNQKINTDGMNFELKPLDGASLSTVTGNGQFRISLETNPKEIKSGSEVTFVFDVTDVFLKDRPISTSYEVSLVHQGNEFFKTSGVSSDSKEVHNEFTAFIPEDVSGPITVQFDNMNDNKLARVGIPVVVDRIQTSEVSIPDWVRNNAGWWAQGQISDKDFASGIEYMIKNEIILVPIEEQGQGSQDIIIPDWVRNNAGWWAQGQIGDKDFASGIQYLVAKGIISV